MKQVKTRFTEADMVAATKPDPVEKKVKCPRCGRVQQFVVCRDGRLYVCGPRVVEIAGFVCESCGKTKIWQPKGGVKA